uniref:Reverse transcriptase domain-containing protein n=1 Tax=Rhabditophanes sp. KR3021 TaxID=114890 RepID=A0AC35TYX1_9BILA
MLSIYLVIRPYIYRNVMAKEQGGFKIGDQNCSFISYADDTTFIAQDPTALQSLTTNLQKESAKVGLHINRDKICLMAYSPDIIYLEKKDKKKRYPLLRKRQEFKITIDGSEIEKVDTFKYLGKEISTEEARPFVSGAKTTQRDFTVFWKLLDVR